MQKIKDTIKIDGVRTNKNLHFVDVFFQRGVLVFKIVLAYNTKAKAEQAMQSMQSENQQEFLAPDYKPYILFVGDVDIDLKNVQEQFAKSITKSKRAQDGIHCKKR